MRTLRALALSSLAVALWVPAAAGKERHWRVTTTLSSSYSNQASWTLTCPGTFSTRLDVNARFTAANLIYHTRSRSVDDAIVKTQMPTGHWHADGSYVPNVPDPVLGYGHVCAPASVPATCDVALVKRTDRSRGKLYPFSRRAGTLNLRLTDVGIEVRPDPSSPDYCGGDMETPATGGPLFPIVYSEAHNRPIPTPLRKLRGRTAFTVRTVPPPFANCASAAYTACVERGAVAFTARFTPRAGRR